MKSKKKKIKIYKKTKTRKSKKQIGGTKNNLHIFLRDATIELIDTINSFKNIKWFFIEGTLLSVLRYGSTFGKIGNRINLVDGDIDIMIIVKDQQDWLNKSKLISDNLRLKKWIINENYTNTCEVSSIKSRLDKLTCYYPKRTPLARTFVDIHSLIDDGKSNLYVHQEDLENNRSNWPFVKWGGSIPRDIIYPLKKTLYNGKSIKIPHKSIELLLNWGNGEYKSGCLLFPYPINSKHRWYNYFKDYIESDLTEEEIKSIVDYSINLNKKGLPSFYELTQGDKYTKCVTDYKNSL